MVFLGVAILCVVAIRGGAFVEGVSNSGTPSPDRLTTGTGRTAVGKDGAKQSANAGAARPSDLQAAATAASTTAGAATSASAAATTSASAATAASTTGTAAASASAAAATSGNATAARSATASAATSASAVIAASTTGTAATSASAAAATSANAAAAAAPPAASNGAARSAVGATDRATEQTEALRQPRRTARPARVSNTRRVSTWRGRTRCTSAVYGVTRGGYLALRRRMRAIMGGASSTSYVPSAPSTVLGEATMVAELTEATRALAGGQLQLQNTMQHELANERNQRLSAVNELRDHTRASCEAEARNRLQLLREQEERIRAEIADSRGSSREDYARERTRREEELAEIRRLIDVLQNGQTEAIDGILECVNANEEEIQRVERESMQRSNRDRESFHRQLADEAALRGRAVQREATLRNDAIQNSVAFLMSRMNRMAGSLNRRVDLAIWISISGFVGLAIFLFLGAFFLGEDQLASPVDWALLGSAGLFCFAAYAYWLAANSVSSH